MRKKDLLKQLHNLQNQVKPDADWQTKNRDILLSQIRAQVPLNFEVKKAKIFSQILSKNFIMPIFRPVLSLTIIVVAVFWAWSASVSATKNSLPGDLFYNVKLTSERMKVNLTLSDAKKASLEMQFAGKRLDEINKIKNAGLNNENLNVPLKKFQENMVNVKSSLAKLEKSDKHAALKIADLVDQKSQEYVGVLTQKQGQVPAIAANAEQAISASKIIAEKALNLIIDEYLAGSKEFSTEQVKGKVNARLTDLRDTLNNAKSDIDKILANKKAEEERLAAEAAKRAEEEKARLEAEAKAKAEAEAAAQAEAQTAESSDTADKTETTEPATTETGTSTTTDNQTSTDQPASDQPAADSTPADQPAVIKSPVENPAPVAEDLPKIEDINDQRIQALILLADAENLLKDNKIKEAFDKIKQADEIGTTVKKVLLANAQYLVDQPAEEETSSSDVKSDEQAK
jgi:hypothetical protein